MKKSLFALTAAALAAQAAPVFSIFELGVQPENAA
jgi:hypothetical protein